MGEFTDLFRLDGRTAFVVGAGSGIGAASARGLADFGAHVVCADLAESHARATARAIEAAGGKADVVRFDVRQASDTQALLDRYGTPDVLVHTPAINVRKPLLSISDEEFDRVVELNLAGTFRLVRGVAAAMADRGSGSIIVFSSMRARVVEPGQGVYAATKAGVVQMLRALAAELAARGVRANAIAPGVVETPLTDQIRADAGWARAYADKNMLRRWARPEEMVGAVVYLASDASSYVTGSLLMADGGWTAADGRFDPPL
ncbi:MAG: SDR family oxidoreductase [Streptosporangiales bacterium]|nr:SDR family oxidoreductase [Streptosporangiales bacterium]